MIAPEQPHERRLYVSWRDPATRSIHPVGLLVRRQHDEADHFSFAYLKQAELLDGFPLLPGFPDLHRRYDAPRLFPVFANRVMPRTRPEFDALAARADLDHDADPFEVLARTGGRRATDRIEVFAGPERSADGQSRCLFFVRGIRHLDGASEAVSRLEVGDELLLVDDRENEVNPRALMVRADDDMPVGWIPEYLVDHVHELRALNGTDPRVVVEHVNDATTPPHLRLLCELSAPWPEGHQVFSDARFQPLVSLD